MAQRKFDAAATLASATEAAAQGRAEAREVASRAGITVTEVATADLMPNPANPAHRSVDNLEELADSIRTVGVLQPLVVRPRRDGDPEGAAWMIVGGHRRWGAAKLAGLERLPVHVTTGEVDVQLMLVENLQRTDITPMEEARSFQLLRDQGFKQAEIAKMVSVSQGQVSKRLSLLKLDETVQDALEQGKVGLDAVYSVLNDTDPDIARKAVQRLAREDREQPATAAELTRVVTSVQYDETQASERQQRIAAAEALGAQVVDRSDLPEGAVRRWDHASYEELGRRRHLYFVPGSSYYDQGEYWTDDPEALSEVAAEQSRRQEAQDRQERERQELQHIKAEVWTRWALTISERSGGEGSDDVARFVLTRGIFSVQGLNHETLSQWVGVPMLREQPAPSHYTFHTTRDPEWEAWVDGLTKAQRWRASRLVVDSAPMWNSDRALYERSLDVAPDLAARWAELDPDVVADQTQHADKDAR